MVELGYSEKYYLHENEVLIDFRWQGESNGYYSETVDLVKIEVSE